MFQRKNKKTKKDYNLTYDNLAIPEIHTPNSQPKALEKDSEFPSNTNDDTVDIITESVAVPEIRIRKKKKK